MGKVNRNKLGKRYRSDRIRVRGTIDPIKANAYNLFNNQQRVRSTVGRKNDKSFTDDNAWMDFERKLGKVKDIRQIPAGRRLAYFLSQKESEKEGIRREFWVHDRENTNGRFSGTIAWKYFIYARSSEMTAFLCFERNEWVWIKKYTNGYLKYSFVYEKKENAVADYEADKVMWAGVEKFS